jgi:peptide/nickel transport system substrate-binding protein
MVRALGASAAAVTAVLACTSGSASLNHAEAGARTAYRAVAPPRPGGTALLADYEYPSTLNPLTARTEAELRLGALLFAPLWGLDPQLRPYADLARQVPTPENGGVRVARDGRSMTVDVRLVSGLRWSDGKPITADDVIFTWKAITDPATHATSTGGYDRIRAMERRSDTEVVWTLDRLYPAYLLLGAGMFVMPAHRLQTVAHSDWSSDAFFQRPDVVSGPFVVTEAVAADHLVFSANLQYTDGRAAAGAYLSGAAAPSHRPYLDQIVFMAPAGKAAEVRALTAQGTDVGFHLLPDDLSDLLEVSASTPVVTTGLRDEFLNPNHAVNRATGRDPPWVGDPSVLEALDRGLDRSALAAAVAARAGRPARGIYPRALASFASAVLLPQGGDVEGARRLLESAGWTPGPDGVRVRSGRRLEFSLTGICGRPDLDHELDQLRRQWLPLGVAVTTGCQTRDAFLQSGTQGAFDMTLTSNQWAPDPSAWAAVAISGRPANWNACRDRALDVALARGEATLSADARRSAYRDAEREWLRYRCTIPLFEVPEVRQVSTRLRNFAPDPAAPDTWNAADWWVAGA